MNEERENWSEKIERHHGLKEWLATRGWDMDDAEAYVGLHDIWLHTELHSAEQTRAEAYERKYNAPPKFAILNEIPPEPKG